MSGMTTRSKSQIPVAKPGTITVDLGTGKRYVLLKADTRMYEDDGITEVMDSDIKSLVYDALNTYFSLSLAGYTPDNYLKLIKNLFASVPENKVLTLTDISKQAVGIAASARDILDDGFYKIESKMIDPITLSTSIETIGLRLDRQSEWVEAKDRIKSTPIDPSKPHRFYNLINDLKTRFATGLTPKFQSPDDLMSAIVPLFQYSKGKKMETFRDALETDSTWANFEKNWKILVSTDLSMATRAEAIRNFAINGNNARVACLELVTENQQLGSYKLTSNELRSVFMTALSKSHPSKWRAVVNGPIKNSAGVEKDYRDSSVKLDDIVEFLAKKKGMNSDSDDESGNTEAWKKGLENTVRSVASDVATLVERTSRFQAREQSREREVERERKPSNRQFNVDPKKERASLLSDVDMPLLVLNSPKKPTT